MYFFHRPACELSFFFQLKSLWEKYMGKTRSKWQSLLLWRHVCQGKGQIHKSRPYALVCMIWQIYITKYDHWTSRMCASAGVDRCTDERTSGHKGSESWTERLQKMNNRLWILQIIQTQWYIIHNNFPGDYQQDVVMTRLPFSLQLLDTSKI